MIVSPSWPCGWLSRGPFSGWPSLVAGRLRWPSGFLGAGLGAVFRRLDGRLVAVSMAVPVPSPVKPERLRLMPLLESVWRGVTHAGAILVPGK